MDRIHVYLEAGAKRTFAGAIDWPGWCRSGRDEASALQALFDAGPRYGAAIASSELAFQAPADLSAFEVVERLEGNATTDFGAPDVPPAADARPVDEAELRRLQALLRSTWRSFDAAVDGAVGKELAKGPRGGGRDLEKIVEHVAGAEMGYLSALGWKFKADESAQRDVEIERLRLAVLDGLVASARGEIAEVGPRGGVRWKPRQFARRVIWHTVDHTWEIEDRVL